MTEEQAVTLRAVVSLARYAEVFSYDDQSTRSASTLLSEGGWLLLADFSSLRPAY